MESYLRRFSCRLGCFWCWWWGGRPTDGKTQVHSAMLFFSDVTCIVMDYGGHSIASSFAVTWRRRLDDDDQLHLLLLPLVVRSKFQSSDSDILIATKLCGRKAWSV